jgi:hypothetical protein
MCLNLLSQLGMIDKKYFKPIDDNKKYIEMSGVYVQKSDNFIFKCDTT